VIAIVASSPYRAEQRDAQQVAHHVRQRRHRQPERRERELLQRARLRLRKQKRGDALKAHICQHKRIVADHQRSKVRLRRAERTHPKVEHQKQHHRKRQRREGVEPVVAHLHPLGAHACPE
jgi:hypothetical protein